MEVNFIVIDAYSPYTAIMARPQLHGMGVVPSTLHLKVKYPYRDWVEELVGNQSMARQCMVAAIRHQTGGEFSASAGRDLQQSQVPVLSAEIKAERVKCEQLERVIIGDDEEKLFQVEVQLPSWERQELIDFLKKNIDVFAWSAYKAPGVDQDFICHYLNVNASAVPKKQPPRCSSREHSEAIKGEVLKLKRARAIKEVFYPKQLANTVVVKKKTRKWRVCMDFMDLNKACPKDPFPLPQIVQLVDATMGHPQMSFLDAFQGYHQIPLALDDQENIAFLTPMGNYHYQDICVLHVKNICLDFM